MQQTKWVGAIYRHFSGIMLVNAVLQYCWIKSWRITHLYTWIFLIYKSRKTVLYSNILGDQNMQKDVFYICQSCIWQWFPTINGEESKTLISLSSESLEIQWDIFKTVYTSSTKKEFLHELVLTWCQNVQQNRNNIWGHGVNLCMFPAHKPPSTGTGILLYEFFSPLHLKPQSDEIWDVV